MENDNIIQDIKQGVADIKTKAAEAESISAKAALTAKEAKEAVENALKEATGVLNEIKSAQVTRDERDALNQKAVNEMLARQKDIQIAQGRGIKSFEGEIEEQMEKNKSNLLSKSQFTINLNRKAVGDMSSANLTGTHFVTPDTRSGITVRPYEEVHMRNLLPVGRTESDLIRHVRDNGGEGGPGMVAPGALKPQMDRDLEIVDANVRKIAVHLRVPEEMVKDIPYLVSFISNIGTQELLQAEDAQILYGDGSGQNLSGLFTNAASFAPGSAAATAAPNRFDVLRAGRMQMRKAKRRPSFAMLSPLDYYLLTSAKDTTGNYILQGGGNGLIPSLDGIPLVEHTAVADNDFLLGDRMAAEIDFRENMSIRMFEQDRDNAIRNLITIVIEERLALPIYYTNGFLKGTFTGGITSLTAVV